MTDTGRRPKQLSSGEWKSVQPSNHEIHDVVARAERGDGVEVPRKAPPGLKREMSFGRQPLEKLRHEERVTGGLLREQARQRLGGLLAERQRIGNELLHVSGRQWLDGDALDGQASLQPLEAAGQRVRGVHLLVPVVANRQQVALLGRRQHELEHGERC